MPESDLNQLRTALQRARAISGLSLRQVAERSGLTKATISRLENGQIASPKPDHLQRLARALEVDVEDFYAAAGFMTPTGLPGLQPYLRTKYGLGTEAASRVEGYVQSLQENEKGGTNDAAEQDN